MKQQHTHNKTAYALGFRLASLVFLWLAIALLLTSAILRFFVLKLDYEWQDINEATFILVAFFTYFGFIFFIVFAWFYILHFFFWKQSVHRIPLFITGNILVFTGILLLSFMWVVSGPTPAFNIFDLMFFSHWKPILRPKIGDSGSLHDATIRTLLILVSVIGFACIVFGLGAMILSLVETKYRDKSLFTSSIVTFVIGATLCLITVILYLIDFDYTNTPPAASNLIMKAPMALSLNVLEDVYVSTSTFGIALVLASFVLLMTSRIRSFGANHRKWFVFSAIAFAIAATDTVIFTILFAIIDLHAPKSPSLIPGLSLDSAYYAIYAVFMALMIISVASTIYGLDHTIRKHSIARAEAR